MSKSRIHLKRKFSTQLIYIIFTLTIFISINVNAFSQTPDSSLTKRIQRKLQLVDSLNQLPASQILYPLTNENHLKITGTEQDCSGALYVCQQTYNQPNSYTGYGSVQEVYNTCLLAQERQSVWYIFTIQTSGTFGFNLTTLNDYDFALYNITATGCAGVPNSTPVRCNFSAQYGNTGLTLPPSVTIPLSYDASQSPLMQGINVTAGQTYALIIDNYTQDNNGYTLTFNGTASIFDNTAPTINPPNTVVNNCNNTITITFSEPIKCSSIATTAPFDFTISGPSAVSITGVSGIGCSGSSGLASQVTLTYSGAATSGSYTIGVQNGSDGNTLLDKCGTAMLTSQSVTVSILGTITASSSPGTICNGSNSSLTSTIIAGASYAWAPSSGLSNASISNPTAIAPTSTTTYTVSVTYGGCTKTAQTTVTVQNKPVASINPMNPIICSGTTSLTASSTMNGSNCTTCTYAWGGGPTTATYSGLGPGTYTVTVTSSAGCASIPVSSTISYASSPPATACNIIFASPAGGGDGLTPTTPTNIVTALSMAACNNSVIKLATGTYTITSKLILTDYVTLEGGYQSNFTQKTSLAGATTINRTNANVEGQPTAPRLVAFEAVSATGFRLQDITITTANAPVATAGNPRGVSIYGIYLNNCSNYNIVRCVIQVGNASAGLAGVSGSAGASGGNGTAGSPGHWDNETWSLSGGAGGSSPCGCPGGAGGHNAWSGGSSTAGIAGSCSGGAGGGRGVSNNCDWFGCSDPDDGGTGSSGSSGSVGSVGTGGSAGTFVSGYWNPGNIGGTGNNGTDGRGGGGGGGGAREDGSCDDGCGSSGSGGGGGGCHGTGGTGGYGGGSAYNVFLYSNGTNGNIIDCDISTPTYGSGGSGGSGGAGGSGGSGGPKIDPDCDVGAGGAGGNGGSGGAGGAGGAGSNGEAYAVRTYSGSALSTNSSLVLSSQPTIIAGDATNGNNNCTNKNINMTSTGSPDWTGSDAPLTGAGSPKTVAYTTTGRKNVVLAGTVGTWTDDFETNKGWAFSGASRGAVAAPCGSECSSPTPRSGSNVLNLPQCANNASTYASITLTLTAPGTFSGYYQIGAESSYDYFTWSIDAVPVRTTNQVSSGACINTWTAFSFAVPAGVHTIYLGFSTDVSGILNGSRTVIDDVQCTNVGGSSGGTYTGFNNIMIAAPSTGTITSSSTGVCPGTSANFSSSVGNTSGYTFQWSTPGLPAGVTSSISTPSAATTNISFTNTNATTQSVTVQLLINSTCCGALAPVTTTFNVYPNPGAITASASNTTPCPNSSVTFTATAPAGASFSWWDAASGGSQIGIGNSYIMSPVGAPGVYTVYVQATNANGCVSTSRQAVSITSTNTLAPTMAAAPTTCGEGNVTMQVSSPTGAQYSYVWYSGACNGTIVQSSTSPYFTTSISANTTFYVAVVNGSCSPGNCTTITPTVSNSTPTSATWTGAIDIDWFRTANWSLVGGVCLPGCETNVTIPNVTNKPVINASALNPNNNPASTGNITIANGSMLTISKGDLYVCGNFDHSGNLTMNAGNVYFTGSSPQTYKKTSTGTGNFLSLIIDNSTGVILQDNAGYKNLTTSQLTLNNGKIKTEGSKEVEIISSTSGAIGGHSTASYVNGRIKRAVVPSGTYEFPLGNDNGYELMRIEVTSVTGGLTSLTSWFTNPTIQGTGLPLSELGGQYQLPLIKSGGTNATTDHTNAGIWVITPTPAAGSANYNLSLYGRNLSTAAGNAFSILKRNTFECSSTLWSLSGVYNSSSYSGNVVYARRTGMSGFSKFAIAPHTMPLPVELLFFNAECDTKNNQVNISWVTSSEINNSHFTIEYSTDGIHYAAIGTVPGAGNSTSILNYSYVHAQIESPVLYYRLMQTDFNGNFEYFNPVSVNCNKEYAFELLGFVPNPAKDNLFVYFTGNKDEEMTLTAYDMTGRLILTEKIMAHYGINKASIEISELSNGVYYFKLSNTERSFSEKIVKQY